MDPSKVGALYLFTDERGNQYAFSIKAQQANNPSENSEWGIWFGELPAAVVKGRVKEINDYIESHEGPNLLEVFRNVCLANARQHA